MNQLKDGDFKSQDDFTRYTTAKIREQKLDPESQRRFFRKMKDAIKIKRSVGTLESPRFWYGINATKDPLVRAKMLHMELKKNPEHRRELLSDLRRMLNAHPSYQKTRDALMVMLRNEQ